MSEQVRSIVVKVPETVPAGGSVELPIPVTTGKTSEILGLKLHADAIAEASTPTTGFAQQITLHISGDFSNVPIFYANSKDAKATGAINVFHFDSGDLSESVGYGGSSVVGTKFQGSQLKLWYKNYTDKPQDGNVYAAIAVREY